MSIGDVTYVELLSEIYMLQLKKKWDRCKDSKFHCL